jgi:hypothetical protein
MRRLNALKASPFKVTEPNRWCSPRFSYAAGDLALIRMEIRNSTQRRRARGGAKRRRKKPILSSLLLFCVSASSRLCVKFCSVSSKRCAFVRLWLIFFSTVRGTSKEQDRYERPEHRSGDLSPAMAPFPPNAIEMSHARPGAPLGPSQTLRRRFPRSTQGHCRVLSRRDRRRRWTPLTHIVAAKESLFAACRQQPARIEPARLANLPKRRIVQEALT